MSTVKQVVKSLAPQQPKAWSIQEVAQDLYTCYSVCFSYPIQPLYALCAPALTAANYLLPDVMKRVGDALPKLVKDALVFDATGKALVKESAITALFLSLVPYCSTDEGRAALSVAVMGMFPKIIQL